MWLLACVATGPADSAGEEDTDPADSGDTTDTADTAESADTGPDSWDSVPDVDTATLPPIECPDRVAYTPAADRAARVFDGTVTWTLEFDADAEAAGYQDCSYTRVYAGLPETNRRPWLCPDCDWLAQGEVELTEGYDCYLQIDDDEAVHIEQLGLGLVDGETWFYRSSVENLSLGALAAIEGDEAAFSLAWSDEASLGEDSAPVGSLLLSATGSFTVSESPEILLTDPDQPSDETYACGWPQCDPGGPSPSWSLADGVVFPNVELEDQCGETVDLWDFWGQWIILDASAPDCGPCQVLAENEHTLIDALGVDGKRATFVTLLNASLSEINLPAELEVRQQWAEAFDLHSPVLADPGLAYALFPAYTGSGGGMSYPTVIVIGPDMTVRGWDSGFSTETMFDDLLPFFAE